MDQRKKVPTGYVEEKCISHDYVSLVNLTWSLILQRYFHFLDQWQRHPIGDRSLAAVNLFLESMAKEARNILSQLCPDHIHLNQQVSKKERVKTKKTHASARRSGFSKSRFSAVYHRLRTYCRCFFSLFLPACRLSCLGFAFLPMKFFYNWKKIATVYNIYIYIYIYICVCIF